MADASTMFLTMKRLMALSFGTITPEASHLTLLTCRASKDQASNLSSKEEEVFSQVSLFSEIRLQTCRIIVNSRQAIDSSGQS